MYLRGLREDISEQEKNIQSMISCICVDVLYDVHKIDTQIDNFSYQEYMRKTELKNKEILHEYYSERMLNETK